MTAAEFDALARSTLIGIFAIAAVLGAVLRETRFCTMGAIGDVVYVGDWTRARQWAVAMGLAVCGFAVLSFIGWVNPHDTLYASTQVRWLSAIVGGLLFGAGMVLASGCGAKNLVRLGGGSLKSLVVLLVMGLAAFMTLKGITAVLRVNTVDAVAIPTAGMAFLPDVLAPMTGVAVSTLRLALGLVLGGLLLVWGSLKSAGGERDARTLTGGILVGAAVVAAWWLSGHFADVPEHPETLEHVYAATQTGRIEALSFVSPVAQGLEWLMFFSDTSRVLTYGVASVLGVVVGAAAQALWRKEFRWQGFADTADLARHLVGAVLMGVGGVTAMGCTIGQGVSAISTLHLGSFVAVASIVLGAVGMLRWQQARMG